MLYNRLSYSQGKSRQKSASAGKLLIWPPYRPSKMFPKFDRFVVSKMQRVHFVKATLWRRCMALREFLWRLVMWRKQRVQSVKFSVKVSLRSRRTALQNCLRQWKTGRLQRVRSAEACLQCVLFVNGSAGVA